MKKFVILLLCMACGLTAFSFGFSQHKYVEYGGNLELIVNVKKGNHPGCIDIYTYGIRKDGVVVLEPKYSSNEAVFPADVFLLVFMDQAERTVHIYSVESGEEVFTYHSPETPPEQTFCGFAFRRVDRRQYQLLECFSCDGAVNCNVITTFCRRRNETYQQKPGNL